MLSIKDRPRLIQRINSILADVSAKTLKEVGLCRATTTLLKSIVCFADKQDIHAKIHASQQTLCQRTGYGRTTISKAFNRLVDLGMIEREQQRKIGHDTWSSPAFWLTPKFVEWLSAMCSLFAHSLSSCAKKNIKEIKPVADSSVAVATKPQRWQTRHGLYIKAVDGVDMAQVVDALNQMSKAQALKVLKTASVAKVNIQQAIGYITHLKTKVGNWYCYLLKALETPQDYAAIVAKQAQKQEKRENVEKLQEWLKANNGKCVNVGGARFKIDNGALVDGARVIVINQRSAEGWAGRLAAGKMVIVDDVAPVVRDAEPQPQTARKGSMESARSAIAGALNILKTKKILRIN